MIFFIVFPTLSLYQGISFLLLSFSLKKFKDQRFLILLFAKTHASSWPISVVMNNNIPDVEESFRSSALVGQSPLL